MSEPAIRTISDTALWAAMYRALETDRPDAHFRDPFARRLAGPRGRQMFESMPPSTRHAWAWMTRTYLYDQFITSQVDEGVDLVLNLAAGLDARPYRMPLPASLRWVEVDLPDLLDYKEELLRGEKPACALECVRMDLADVPARRELFARLGASAQRVLVLSEGLLIYLSREEVAALAEDLAAPPSFQRWVLEIGSPGLIKMMQKQIGQRLSDAGAPFQFAPEEGPGFFTAHRWQPLDVRSLLKTAAKLKRLSLFMRLMALLPESKGKQGSRPWSAVCLMGRN